MTWEEVIAAVERGNPLTYHTPLDIKPVKVKCKMVPYTKEPKIHYAPLGTWGQGLTADAGHAERFQLDTGFIDENRDRARVVFPDGRIRMVRVSSIKGLPNMISHVHGWIAGRKVMGRLVLKAAGMNIHGKIVTVYHFAPYVCGGVGELVQAKTTVIRTLCGTLKPLGRTTYHIGNITCPRCLRKESIHNPRMGVQHP